MKIIVEYPNSVPQIEKAEKITKWDYGSPESPNGSPETRGDGKSLL